MGSILKRGFRAIVNFYAIPPLGPDSPEPTRRFSHYL
jgi:hypothetical protein